MEVHSDLDLIIIGKTGNGKSATGNSILRKPDVFKSAYNTTSITDIPQTGFTTLNGRVIKVVDCPGVLDTDIDETGAVELVKEALQYALLANPSGYHAFLIVVKFAQRFTKEEQDSIEILKIILGKDVIKSHGIVVLCNGDTFTYFKKTQGLTIEEFCTQQKGYFKKLITECNNRVIVFDNITEDETIKNNQLETLIKAVDALKTNTSRYSTQDFQKANDLSASILPEKKLFIYESWLLQKLHNINNNDTVDNKLKTLNQIQKCVQFLLLELLKINETSLLLTELKAIVEATNTYITNNIIDLLHDLQPNTAATSEGSLEKQQLNRNYKIEEQRDQNLCEIEERFLKLQRELDVGFFKKCFIVIKKFGDSLFDINRINPTL